MRRAKKKISSGLTTDYRSILTYPELHSCSSLIQYKQQEELLLPSWHVKASPSLAKGRMQLSQGQRIKVTRRVATVCRESVFRCGGSGSNALKLSSSC